MSQPIYGTERALRNSSHGIGTTHTTTDDKCSSNKAEVNDGICQRIFTLK
jgi:hypothetical protein